MNLARITVIGEIPGNESGHNIKHTTSLYTRIFKRCCFKHTVNTHLDSLRSLSEKLLHKKEYATGYAHLQQNLIINMSSKLSKCNMCAAKTYLWQSMNVGVSNGPSGLVKHCKFRSRPEKKKHRRTHTSLCL